jgi:hypothetical protein
MLLLAWNIRQGGGSRLARIADALARQDADVLVLSEYGEYEGVVRVSRRVFQSLLTDAPTPEGCLEAYYLHRTRLELAHSVVEDPVLRC